MTPEQHKVMEQALEALIESARLLGATQTKKGFGCYTQEDATLESSLHESIAKHSNTLRTRPEKDIESSFTKAEQQLDSLSDKEIKSLIPHYDNWNYEIGFDEVVDFANSVIAAYKTKNGIK